MDANLAWEMSYARVKKHCAFICIHSRVAAGGRGSTAGGGDLGNSFELLLQKFTEFLTESLGDPLRARFQSDSTLTGI